ncbi:putative PPE family protein PPE2 [Mycobacterium simulans]|uniref:Putative PPE family protein PPE2 n=1 Tax=Mycobacterium simulans TaxID=627089 RepID=A0A7Z7IMD8_9MYCO|nr:PPE family protein [Mycobacterium simulans]SOJ55124.1 putative PPE family protein PPE2 [Mycobacterium simulans]
MTVPIWMASPPEVHSALLSSGPGPGPLLAAAAAWHSLSIEYAATAEELAALLAAVHGGTWDGPTAAAYAAAHVRYLAWLMQASANNAAMAAQQETVAAAWTTALAAMPTLPELAANHTVHAALVATNFFGINTVPIALNEADYARMWIQAATVMSVYQGVATTAVAAAPRTTPAPQIMKANAPAAAQLLPQPSDWQQLILQFLQEIGYTAFYNNVIQPFITWLANIPFLQALFAFDPYLLILGNPLTYLSPLNIAFAIGYPMDIGTYVALLSETFAFIAADLAAAFASGNPATIGFALLFATVEAVGTIITDTIALLKTLLEQTLVLLPAIVALVSAPLASLATGAVLVPIGAKGLAVLVAVPPALPVTPATPPIAGLAPNIPTSTSSPTPTPADVTAPPPTSASPAPPTTAAPPVTGAGIGAGMGAGMENFAYLVGDLNSVAKRGAGSSARKKAPEPDSAEEPTAAATPQEPARSQRRRRTKVRQIDRGWGYMDLEPDIGASGQGAGSLGFAGTTPKETGTAAAGLTTLADDEFGGGPRMPLMPGTWGEADG